MAVLTLACLMRRPSPQPTLIPSPPQPTLPSKFLLFPGSRFLLSLGFSMWYLHALESPSLSIQPSTHAPTGQTGIVFCLQVGPYNKFGRRGAGPQRELDCEKSRGSRVTRTGLQPHPLLALRSRASDLSSLNCSFLAVFADTDVCFRRFLWRSES